MKITDLSVTLFKWDHPPWKTGRGSFGGEIQMGVLEIQTDNDVKGHAFLGSSLQGAEAYISPLLTLLKPVVIGRNPLDIGAIWLDLWKSHRNVSFRAIGAVDVVFIPVGGVFTINAQQAWQIATRLSPKVVIPMHYRIRGLSLSLDTVEKFIEVGLMDTFGKWLNFQIGIDIKDFIYHDVQLGLVKVV